MPLGRGAVIPTLALGLLGAGAVAIVASLPSPDAVAGQIAAAVKHATGRDLLIRGPVRIAWGWTPAISLNDVALANVEGGSRPVMATVPRIDAQVPLLGLVFGRVALDRLILVKPAIWLERSKSGEPNWRLSPFTPGVALAPPRPGPAPGEGGSGIAFTSLHAEDATVTLHDAEGDSVFAVPSLDLSAPAPDTPIGVAGRIVAGSLAIDVSGEMGSWAGLQEVDRKTPWPIRLTLAAGDARATLTGGATKPMLMRGFSLKLDGTAPDLSRLQPLFPGTTLPALRDVAVTAQIAEGPAGNTQLSGLTATAGASDLGGYAEGLSLTRAELAMPRTDRPVRIAAEGQFGGQPLRLSGTIGAPGALVGGATVAGAMPVDLSASAAGASLTARGNIANPARLTGADIALSARVPDLAALSPLVGRPLPAFQAIVATARLRDRDGGLGRGVILQNVKLTAAQGDLGGDLTIGADPALSVQGTVNAARLDLDLIAAALPAPPPPDSVTAPGTPPAAPFISDARLPLDALRSGDADLRFRVAALILGGATYRDATGRIVLKDGKLRLDPLTAQAQGSALYGRLVIDTTAQPEPSVQVALRSGNVPLKWVLDAAGLPEDATGTAEVDLDLRGAGSTPQAIVAGGNGRLGIAAVNGRIGGRVLDALIADPLRKAGTASMRFAGQSELRCLAVRLDLRGGTATVRAFTLNAADAQVDAAGTIDLSRDTFALVLTPVGRGGAADGTPLRVTGPFSDWSAALLAGASDPLAGARLPRRLLDPGAEGCTGPLAVARDGRAGPMPAALTAPLTPPSLLPPMTPIPLAPMTQFPPRPAPIPLAPGQAPIPLTPPGPGARPLPPPVPVPQAGRPPGAGGTAKPVDLFQFLR